MNRTARLAAAVVIAVGLVACQKTVPTSIAKADPTTGKINDLGAFTGEWNGHGGGVVIDDTGHGVQTVHVSASDPGAKTQFAITSIKRTSDGLVAEYSAEGKTGTLTFFCTSDDGNLNRGDLTMDFWPLHIEINDLDWKKRDAAIQFKRDKYCTNQQA